jgi:hypothetical protein
MLLKQKTHHESDLARLMNDQIFYRNEKRNYSFYRKPKLFY